MGTLYWDIRRGTLAEVGGRAGVWVDNKVDFFIREEEGVQ
jgi:hypothetical protein